MDSRWARVARGATAAGFATFVAALSHSIAGGTAPSVFGVFASLLLSIAVSTVLTGRTPALWRLALSVAVSQVLFHLVFSAAGSPTVVAHSHTSHEFVPDLVTHGHPASMWLAHVVAGLVTIAAFRFGESAVRGLVWAVRLVMTRLLAAPSFETGISHPLARVVTDRVYVARDVASLLSTMRHRGPPTASV